MLKFAIAAAVLLSAVSSLGQTVYLEDLGSDFVPAAGDWLGNLVGYRISTNQAAIRKIDGSIIDLGTFGGAESRATGISRDGTVVVGWAQNAGGVQNSFRAANGGPIAAIFSNNATNNQAVGVDDDGTVYINRQSGATTRQIYEWFPGIASSFLLVDNAQATGVNRLGIVVFNDTLNGSAAYFDGTRHSLPAGFHPSVSNNDYYWIPGSIGSLAAFFGFGRPTAQTVPSIQSLGDTSVANGGSADYIVGTTSGTVFFYDIYGEALIDLNAADFQGAQALYLSTIIGIADENMFFGKYIDLTNQERYFRGYLEGTFPTESETRFGDYNDDGIVNAADYTVWRDTFGGTAYFFHGADGSGNGLVDIPDYQTWRTRFGQETRKSAAGESAPEPTSLLLTTTALFAIALAAPRFVAKTPRTNCRSG